VLARVVRSGLEESVHLGHVAACDASGRVVASAGNPARIVFARSSLKPLQAAVSMAMWGDPLDDADVAIMCGSHNGEPVHVDAVRRLLRRTILEESALRCPPAWPWHVEDAHMYEAPRSILHNCSGKHAGMLIASFGNGWDVENYLDPEHPLQQRIREWGGPVMGVAEPAIGVDGCGAPVFAVPLHAMATLFARLVTADGPDLISAGMRRAVEAMRAEPYLVAGRNRIDTALMQQIDTLVVKSGAEGLVCAGIIERGLGVAVRIDDGSARATGPALIRALHLLEVVGSEQVEALEGLARPPVLGGSRPVGALTSTFSFD